MVFAHLLEGVHNLAIHQSKIAAVLGDVQIGQPIDQAIEESGGDALKPSLAPAGGAHRQHQFCATLPLRHQVQNDLGRVLQISVYHHHSFPAREIHPGGDGDLMPEITRQTEHTHACIFRLQCAHNLQGAIGAAVIDQKQFGRAIQPVHHRARAPVKLGQRFGFVKNGRYYRVFWGAHYSDARHNPNGAERTSVIIHTLRQPFFQQLLVQMHTTCNDFLGITFARKEKPSAMKHPNLPSLCVLTTTALPTGSAASTKSFAGSPLARSRPRISRAFSPARRSFIFWRKSKPMSMST